MINEGEDCPETLLVHVEAAKSDAKEKAHNKTP